MDELKLCSCKGVGHRHRTPKGDAVILCDGCGKRLFGNKKIITGLWNLQSQFAEVKQENERMNAAVGIWQGRSLKNAQAYRKYHKLCKQAYNALREPNPDKYGHKTTVIYEKLSAIFNKNHNKERGLKQS